MEKEIKYNDKYNYYDISTHNEDIIFTPKEGHIATVIWLPGLKDSALSYFDDIIDSKRFVPKKFKVKVLTAPKSIKNDPCGWSWYQTISREKFEIGNYEENVLRIREEIDKEAKILNNSYNKIFLGGFSQGSVMSFLVGLSIPAEKTLGGLICCSGYLSSNTKIREDEKALAMPILICHGKKDSRITLEFAAKSQQVLVENRYNAVYKVYDFEHELRWDEYSDIRLFLTGIAADF